MEKEDPDDVMKSLANDFNDFIAKLSSDVTETNRPTGWDDPKVNVHGTKEVGTRCGSDKGNVKANFTPSFDKVLQGNPIKKVVKIQELRNFEVVDGAAVAIPIEAVEEVSSRFANTLYGYFIGKRLAFWLVENYVKNIWAKYGLRRVQLHEEFFLFQFDTKEGMESVMENGPWLIRLVPLILNEWTLNTILKKDEIKSAPLWVKLHHVPIVAYSEVGNTYVRALIEISAEEELKESLVIAIPLCNGKGHTLATIDIEYEWTPPQCTICRVFDHVDDKCPKRPKVDVPTKDMDDGFIMVIKKKAKAKQNKKTRHVEGVRLSKPALNLQYRRVEKAETSKNIATMVNGNVNVTKVSPATTIQNDPILKKPYTLMDDNVILKNTFSALTDDEDAGPDTSSILNEDSECEAIDEELIMEGPTSDPNIKGANTPVKKKPKGADGVLKKIDRIMANLELHDTFLGLHAIFQPYRISDHAPAVLFIPTTIKVKPRPFKFTNILVHHRRFKEVVLDGWNMSVSGFHMYKIMQKLKYLKKPFRKLLYDHGNLHENVKRLRHELDTVQHDLDLDLFNSNLRDEEAAYVQVFNEASLMEERFLRQKAKVDWLRDGDANSAYFYKLVKNRVTRSRIDIVTDLEGVISENEKVADAFVSHYEIFLGQSGTVTPLNVSNLFQKRLNEMDALEMIHAVSDKEIKDAVFSMGNDKSPGSDGFTEAFFKEA
ncbi:zinc knuckle CX2CX4HX4C containing protein [Tanacetum coccineum]